MASAAPPSGLRPASAARPYLTARAVASRYELSRQGAHLAIKSLRDLEILKDTGAVDSHNARIYVAPEVVRVV